MEVVGAVASVVSALVECGKFICRPIYRHTNNFFRLQSNLNALDRKKMTLKDLKDNVVSELEAANQNGNLPTPQIQEWLRDVESVMSVADPLQPGVLTNNDPGVSGCFFKCGLSRKVAKTLKEVERLTSGDSYPAQVVAVDHDQAKVVEHMPGPSVEDQTTASQNLAKITVLLEEPEVRTVGVWGMGGVGKTTLVKNLNNKLESSSSTSQPFGKVIWATVSKEMSLKRVQTRIAERLNLSAREGDEETMAIRLHQRLMREDKFLLILDDVWERIDLDKLGIPRPEVHMGYKILLTSRSRAICTQMNMDREFKVVVLDDEEAWKLFSTRVGEVVDSEQILPLAQAIVRECCGLPLAIITMGAAMRRKESVVLWKDALNEMRRSVPSAVGLEKEVFNPLKWSYDSLQGSNVKSCFLFCCLYPEDFVIDVIELVECWVGEGLIDARLNYDDSLNRGIAMVEHLKDVCLLEQGDGTSAMWPYVKMHDIVRDVAIWIASSEAEGCRSLVRSGIGLADISEVEFTESFKRVSLMNNNLKMLPADNFQFEDCSQACTLFLQGNYRLEEIPQGFLQQFQGLKVLNLSGTGITELPRGIESLTRLWKLDLSYTSHLRAIPAGVMCQLSCLEVLDMIESVYRWDVREVVEDGNASFEELGCLNKLRSLSIQIGSKSIARLDSVDLTWMSRLTRFAISNGGSLLFGRGREKWLVINSTSPTNGMTIEGMLVYATCLCLDDLRGEIQLDGMLEKLAMNNNAPFYALKHLVIRGAVMNGGSCGTTCHDFLPNLEVLHLFNIRSPEGITESIVGRLGLKFSKLRTMKLWKCHSMKYLLTVGDRGGLIQSLGNLQEIEIWDCYRLEELFQYVGVVDQCVLPKLREITVRNCPVLKKLPLSIQNANTMTEIRGEEAWWSQLEWDDIATKNSLQHLFKATTN